MSIKKIIVKYLAKKNKKNIDSWSKNSISNQKKLFKKLMFNLVRTEFGKDVGAFEEIEIEEFRKKCSIKSYEDFSSYIKKISLGEKNVLWPGEPLYFAKTSGTTSGTKYIPLTKKMLDYQIKSSKEALLLYAFKTKKYDTINGKMMFIQGSPLLTKHNKINTGRLSGIVANHVPFFLKSNRLPSRKVNIINTWEDKLEKIINETIGVDLRLIGGIPPWVIMYFQKILERTREETILDIFPNLSLYVHGGVNFSPYKKTLKSIMPKADFLEFFPASEGFFAYQDDIEKEGLLLLTNHGVFYEFVEVDQFLNNNHKRLSLEDVELNKNYVLIISTISGLWSYNIGDTVRFVDLKPFRVVVTGRIKHFISAFGEHVIGKEVESALENSVDKFGGKVVAFTVCPNINPKKGLPHHEWFIEFNEKPNQFNKFCVHLDDMVRKQNIYYNDLIRDQVLKPLVVNCVKGGSFNKYMDSIGKLGGQNKCPSLSNNRKIGNFLIEYIV